MARACSLTLVTATAMANDLVRWGIDFRTAHTVVGSAVREAIAADRDWLELPSGTAGSAPDAYTPEAVISRHTRGGGPGAFDEIFRTVRDHWTRGAVWLLDIVG